MSTIKHIAFLEREWGNSHEKKVACDMAFYFEDRYESITEDIAELRRGTAKYCFEGPADESGDAYDEGEFAIYEVYEADIELDEEYDYLWSGVIIDSTRKLCEVYVCATEEQAGWLKENAYYKSITIKFKKS